jgi:Tfp pilus tip-associated adhesin PilY1
LTLAIPASSASERSISRPLVVGGIVFFTTFIPDDDLCMGNGETWLFAVDWKSGEFLTDPVFDLNKDKTFSTEDTTVKQTNGTTSKLSGVYIGKGKPSDELALHNDILYVGTTEQAPLPIKVNIPAMQARLESWQQLSD